MNIKVTVDHSVNAAYIELADAEVERTVKLRDAVMIDLDKYGMVVGIEMLGIDVDLPLQQLRDEYHVDSKVVDVLYNLRPNLGYQLARFQQTTEGSSEKVEQFV